MASSLQEEEDAIVAKLSKRHFLVFLSARHNGQSSLKVEDVKEKGDVKARRPDLFYVKEGHFREIILN